MITILNHATCSCEDGKYVESVINNSVVMCDEILPPKKKLFQQKLLQQK